ncbi:monovalent cation/H(+) antiporter subunit G [Arthrobacter agilis]|uniref:monovalent cation/H(+) antiporter subunit G n=1 Tax=Arthrobacter agilis TaxID=37921 RepID=UPI000B35B792|nr:monovalent cation/H(+) antiporter subunit G [Arthrobacter agilis]OUM43112.1 sodium:proton antiporter [Arthrobacter agilis]PPB46057.1 Na+/H+ antiporter subunit G [Arthrobacter agilis]TPV25599.1 monovalent cation/H(+) antiporter subunit G [Arthrobacter agilis]VDR33368.1 Multiple resistance and pH homeostasis protein G [Arthrobacter agilis]
MVQDVIVSVLLIGGALMSLAAGIGLTRFPDLLSRMHAATKPQVLGLLLFLLALAVENGSWVLVPILVLCWIFQLLTSPVSAHMVGRAGYRTRHLQRELLTLDELDDIVAKAADEVDGRAAGDDRARTAGTAGSPAGQDDSPTAGPPDRSEA